ncbi:MAG: RluA family pseudouridine synthase [Nanobdellota archaeon]
MKMRYRVNTLHPSEDSNLSRSILKEFLFFNDENEVSEWIASSLVRVNSEVCKNADMKITAEDHIEIYTPESYEPPVNKVYEVLYDDEHILIINKPAPLPVHPAGKYWFHTLSQILIDDGKLTAGTVYPTHRLDKETSGIVIFAKDRQTSSRLQQDFAARNIEKEYVALCKGIPEHKKGVLNYPLKKSFLGSLRDIMILSDEGKESHTEYEVIASDKKSNTSLISLRPRTGRRHQLRAHLAALGCPIIGDKLYGNHPERYEDFVRRTEEFEQEIIEKLGARRQLLHCQKMSFIHPHSKERVVIEAQIPQDIILALEKSNLHSQIKKQITS